MGKRREVCIRKCVEIANDVLEKVSTYVTSGRERWLSLRKEGFWNCVNVEFMICFCQLFPFWEKSSTEWYFIQIRWIDEHIKGPSQSQN